MGLRKLNNKAPKLHVKIESPEGMIWEGEARTLSSENVAGAFDILPYHARFISIIREKPIMIETGSEVKKFEFPRALVFAHDDTVSIYTGL